MENNEGGKGSNERVTERLCQAAISVELFNLLDEKIHMDTTEGEAMRKAVDLFYDKENCFYLVFTYFFDLLEGISLICTGKINNPRRGVSIAKVQHNNV
uniref:B1292H11.26 protein n=2 Tax=Oryza sativa subsp. japonica TaxID=39947 RepID=Q7XPD7_ORYSJ|nr:OSJNBa0042N22.1 [Oryza sativa Japonica Group]CAE76040.1 B1292H11.26 [Oryza sativa Japonica Group]